MPFPPYLPLESLHNHLPPLCLSIYLQLPSYQVNDIVKALVGPIYEARVRKYVDANDLSDANRVSKTR